VIVDVLLAVLLLSYAVTGYRQGLLVSTMSLVGFLSGGALGMWLLPQLLQRWNGVGDNVLWHTVLLVFGVFVLASIGQGLAVSAATRLRRQVRLKPARVLDAFLGGVASLVAVSILVWFVAGAVRGGAPAPLARAIGSSRILQTIDQAVPAQTSQLFAGFRALLDREGFPRVFDGVQVEPIPSVASPNPAVTASRGVAAAGASVVKITGVAAACNRGQEGSGWVVSPGRVVTNAHVVAGMASPRVRVQGTGRSYDSRVVVFDPQRDLAVLDVSGLRAPALREGDQLGRGDGAVVAGFPLDGPYRLDPARVRTVLSARGSDIYGAPGTVREVYSLYARVEPGNSGGPLLSRDGRVVGIVFAKSLDDVSTGYALTLGEAAPVLDAARAATAPVGTGGCAAG
jgi:S1-C subfamily serine protease